jgi:hypothetical protein
MPDETPVQVDVAAFRERSYPERTRLLDALRDVPAAQERTLADLLIANAQTSFGIEHAFARIRSLRDYRAAVPIREYQGLQPWIERAAAGEPGVLTADPPLVFFTSSGSTGAHKKVPVTARFMRHVYFPFYFAALATVVEHFPETVADLDATLSLKHDVLTRPSTTASGRPHVGASQVDFARVFGEPLAAEPGTRARWSTSPVPVADDDHVEKMYLRLRQAVEHDVRCVIGVNPAMVAALPRQLAAWWPQIVRDLRDGTLGGRPGAQPNPQRAAELERLAGTFGTLRPAHVWPRFQLVYCWTTGLASLYLPRVREEFGAGVTMLPAPVAASEGPLGVPVDRHPTAGVPTASCVVYEYLDADEEIKPDSDTLSIADLEPGREYHVILSHTGGLYRYALGDVVRVVDRFDGAPRIQYAGRNQTSNAVGERLRESHVVRALSGALASTGLAVANATCRVDTPSGGGRPRLELAVAPEQRPSQAELAALTTAVDEQLTRIASGYHQARRGGLLDAPVLRLTASDAFFREWQATVAGGVRPTQVKDRVFQRDPAVWRRLLEDR